MRAGEAAATKIVETEASAVADAVPAAPAKAAHRIRYLDGQRGLAILLVMRLTISA